MNPRALPVAPDELSTAIAVISAMITPAVLILGSSSLIAATSTRLSRSLERSRKLAQDIETLLENRAKVAVEKEKLGHLIEQLTTSTRRARLLQRAMTALYVALAAFVATSVTLGLDAVVGAEHRFVLVTIVLIGALILFYASIVLIAESRLALRAVNREIRFLGRVATRDKSHPQEAQQLENLGTT